MKQIAANKALIERYLAARDTLMGGSGSEDLVVEEFSEDTGLAKTSSDSDDTVEGGGTNPSKALDDYFTAITVEVSATSDKQSTHSTQSSYSTGVSAGWGFFRASASASYSQSHSESMSELANSEVKISFECMRVDISRPWLRAELFYDDELVPGPDVK